MGENSKTDLKYVTCGVPQGSILETNSDSNIC